MLYLENKKPMFGSKAYSNKISNKNNAHMHNVNYFYGKKAMKFHCSQWIDFLEHPGRDFSKKIQNVKDVFTSRYVTITFFYFFASFTNFLLFLFFYFLAFASK